MLEEKYSQISQNYYLQSDCCYSTKLSKFELFFLSGFVLTGIFSNLFTKNHLEESQMAAV